MKKSKIIIFFLALFLAFNCSFSFARDLELEYPKMEEFSPEETSVSLPKYIEYLFNFALWALGIVALISLIAGGIRWLTSGDNPSIKKDAKSQIYASFLGIIILIFSIMIISQINPDLLEMSEIEIKGQNFAFAGNEESSRKLEINYPSIGNFTPETTSIRLDEYVRYIFNFVLWGVGILALMMIVSAGARYLLSPVKPEEKKEAKNQITSALIGLLILISSIIILNTINTDIQDITVSDLKEPIVMGSGIWICNQEIENFEEFMKGELELEQEERDQKIDEISRRCFRASSKSTVPKDFEIKNLYLVGDEDKDLEYAVVFHENDNFTGECILRYDTSKLGSFDPRAVTPLILRKEAKGEGVTFYSHRDFNEGVTEEEGAEKSETYQSTGTSQEEGVKFVGLEPCYSIKIDEDEEWIAVIYKAPDLQSIPSNFGGGAGDIVQNARICEVFDKSDRNLEDDYTGTFCSEGFWGWNRMPCAHAVRILKGQIMEE